MFDPSALDDEDDEDIGTPRAEPPLTHDGIPIRGWLGGEPVPDLDRIPQERWREVLMPLRHQTRQFAKAGAQRDVIAAAILVGELWLEDGDARDRAVSAPPPSMPAGVPPRRGAGRQVNFRVGPEDYERLVEAARLFAMPPTTLARVLTVRGVDRALYEHQRRP